MKVEDERENQVFSACNRDEDEARIVENQRGLRVVGASTGTKFCNSLEGASTGSELFNALQTPEAKFALSRLGALVFVKISLEDANGLLVLIWLQGCIGYKKLKHG
ncbi:unnamed protein product [Vicia faba]|uniref:Uncharacterized protein n=1 Tax=Vicia faba TaxID=3906 RepID=A0AAV0YP79_VICFA|nr:unnamed protein product [Vicia faba]